jgi:anti-sigma factor RsiW
MARQADHHRAEDLISAYLDQQVTAEEKQFFERHIDACADCRAQLEATRSMVAALQAMPAVKAPRSFVLPREMANNPRSIFPLSRVTADGAGCACVCRVLCRRFADQPIGEWWRRAVDSCGGSCTAARTSGRS